ncbi:alpha-amylase family glycosyl hydrolase [Pseudonocardia phyllosphaerae]|uniref:alpha-amylase family glycosyl hydrolase n=1 Tax=Pseudonocardia phyllosphaerae TaxID=3390502 RepID=UPI0039785582
MSTPDWVRHAIWWHVYPLGATGAFPSGDKEPDGALHDLRRLVPWLDHAQRLGTNGLLLGPVFASATHGYDTVDHLRIDPRLGTETSFDELVAAAHERGLRVLLDGVFNHVAPDHPWAVAARENPDGPEAALFRRDEHGGIATFEGHGGLLALDHSRPEVRDHVVEIMEHWLERGIDGWRLDAAYTVPDEFWADVLPRVRQHFGDAWFLGEVIHGDHPAITAATTIDALTQYELWKAVWSSLNDHNPHELAWALTRHDGFVEAGSVPQTFVGNHDVTRLATVLDDRRQLPLAVVVLCTVAGSPSVYAGDEWAQQGLKEEREGGDDAVRPELPVDGELPADADQNVLALHQELIGLRRRHPWLYAARTEIEETTDRRLVYVSHGELDGTAGALRVTLDYGDGDAAPSWSVDEV